MSEYRRYFIPGATYFFTVVTARRAPLFAQAAARELFGNVFRRCLKRDPVEVIAIVLLPDHLHTIWLLPSGDDGYARRWRQIKRDFAREWLAAGGCEQWLSPGQVRQRRRGVWQRRFWEHTIRDEADLERHFDYVHYNPVKHGLVKYVRDWPWSSFHRWVRAGHYSPDWAACGGAIRIAHGVGE